MNYVPVCAETIANSEMGKTMTVCLNTRRVNAGTVGLSNSVYITC